MWSVDLKSSITKELALRKKRLIFKSKGSILQQNIPTLENGLVTLNILSFCLLLFFFFNFCAKLPCASCSLYKFGGMFYQVPSPTSPELKLFPCKCFRGKLGILESVGIFKGELITWAWGASVIFGRKTD